MGLLIRGGRKCIGGESVLAHLGGRGVKWDCKSEDGESA